MKPGPLRSVAGWRLAVPGGPEAAAAGELRARAASTPRPGRLRRAGRLMVAAGLAYGVSGGGQPA